MTNWIQRSSLYLMIWANEAKQTDRGEGRGQSQLLLLVESVVDLKSFGGDPAKENSIFDYCTKVGKLTDDMEEMRMAFRQD